LNFLSGTLFVSWLTAGVVFGLAFLVPMIATSVLYVCCRKSEADELKNDY
jgi:hypothetical protein